MARSFYGDLKQLSEIQLAFISDVLDKEGYKDARVTINSVGEAGDNYIANVKRIVAEKNEETFQMIAKVAPTIEQMRAQMRTHNLFSNEFIMYTEVLPKYTEYEMSVGIPEKERLRYAKCYGCLMDEPNEVILLEDLQVSGFLIFDRFKPLKQDCIRHVIKSFAKLHALSYVFKQREPDAFDSYKTKLFDAWSHFASDEVMKVFFKSIENDAVALLDSRKQKDVIKKTLENMSDVLKDLIDFDSDSKYSVIQQGDSWTNNLMFQLEGGKPISCCMIDYQISRISSPVADLHYMIFNCTDYETRAKHFYDWIEFYHSELDKTLTKFRLKVNNVYPRDQLDADLKRHGKAAPIFIGIINSAVTRKNDDAAKMKEFMESVNMTDMEHVYALVNESKITATDDDTKELFKSRVGGAIDSLFDFGLI